MLALGAAAGGLPAADEELEELEEELEEPAEEGVTAGGAGRLGKLGAGFDSASSPSTTMGLPSAPCWPSDEPVLSSSLCLLVERAACRASRSSVSSWCLVASFTEKCGTSKGQRASSHCLPVKRKGAGARGLPERLRDVVRDACALFACFRWASSNFCFALQRMGT